MSSGVRDRTRELLRAQLADAILAVFLERGYATVTVEDAAREVGISRATFFRYFGNKEDVVVASVENSGIDYAAGIRVLPRNAQCTGWELVRTAIEPVVLTATRDPDRLRARLRLIAGEPALRARLRERRAESTEALAAALTERLHAPLTARVLASAGLAAVDLAWEEWAMSEGRDFRATVDSVFACLETAGR
ncbi:TetR family transcriptional regulator [Kocuria turfanensis]|uniref:TetR family transcriptional regulator n=1 Tax=Kocuria turfanensis TaxID=388357 RepID=UPI0040357560